MSANALALYPSKFTMCHSEWDEESVIIVFVEHGIAYIGKSFGNSFSPWVICAEPLQVDLIFSGFNLFET